MSDRLTLLVLTPQSMGLADPRFSIWVNIAKLEIDQNIRLFNQLQGKVSDPSLPTPRPVPKEVRIDSFIEYDGCDENEENIYLKSLVACDGNDARLTYLTAQEFGRLDLDEDSIQEHKAIMTFVKALPDDTPIILYWS